MIHRKLLLIFTAFSLSFSHAQKAPENATAHSLTSTEKQGISKRQFRNSAITASAFVGGSLIALTGNAIFSDELFKDSRNLHFADFRTNADDYLSLAPASAVYGLNLLGVEGRHNFGNRSLIIAKAGVLTTAVVYGLKFGVGRLRPDETQSTSFPSGHTAIAFATATFLHREYGHQSIWYSIAGYANASAVGVLRVLNNRHYLSDVLMGAGVGIFCTNLVYYTHQYRWFKGNQELSLIPQYWDGSLGMYLSFKF